MRCRSWNCPDCSDGRRRRLVAEAIGGQPNTFITLTLRHEAGADPAAQAKRLSRGWRLIRLRAMRALGIKKLPFLAVVERTKLGTPHLHILCRLKWLNQAWLSAAADEILSAPIVDIRRIDGHRSVASYCAKYVGKDPAQFGSCKRYWKSQDYELREDRKKGAHRPRQSPGERVNQPLAHVCHQWRQMGYEVSYIDNWRARARPPPGGLWQ